MFDHPLGRGGNRILEAWVGAESRFLWPAALPPLLLPVLLPTTCTYCLLPCSALAPFTAGGVWSLRSDSLAMKSLTMSQVSSSVSSDLESPLLRDKKTVFPEKKADAHATCQAPGHRGEQTQAPFGGTLGRGGEQIFGSLGRVLGRVSGGVGRNFIIPRTCIRIISTM